MEAVYQFMPRRRARRAPLLIAAARCVDPVVCTGADFEVGWLPVPLHQAGNPRIQPGTPGYVEAALLEPKPGLPPTAAHLAGLPEQQARGPAKVVVRARYQDARASPWLSERTQILAVALPTMIGGTPGAEDLFTLFDDAIDRLLAAIAD
jgi:zinc/manganese transport system substrate-binding protein